MTRVLCLTESRDRFVPATHYVMREGGHLSETGQVAIIDNVEMRVHGYEPDMETARATCRALNEMRHDET